MADKFEGNIHTQKSLDELNNYLKNNMDFEKSKFSQSSIKKYVVVLTK